MKPKTNSLTTPHAKFIKFACVVIGLQARIVHSKYIAMDKNDYDYSSWYPLEHYSDGFFQQKVSMSL